METTSHEKTSPAWRTRFVKSAIHLNLLVQLLFDLLFTTTRPKSSPQSIRAGLARLVVVTDDGCILITCLNRIGDENHCSITHQHVSTTLVPATGWK